MRRSWISRFQPVRRRTGVTAKVISKKRNVQIPVWSVISSMGLAPKVFVSAWPANMSKGMTQAINTPTFRSGCFHLVVMMASARLEIFFEIHTTVELRDLIGIAIEYEGFAFGILTDSALTSLAPAWMRHIRIDVGVKPIFMRGSQLPGTYWLLLKQTYLNDRLDALEAILPGYD